MRTVWAGLITFCIFSWCAGILLTARAYRAAGTFIRKCEADIRLSSNMGRVATALEQEIARRKTGGG